jgi:hypothetical protein
MLKNILKLEGAQALSSEQKKSINGNGGIPKWCLNSYSQCIRSGRKPKYCFDSECID